MEKRNVVVIGNGMVGHRFCERLAELDPEGQFKIITFCEEPRPAYDRVHLTEFFSGKTADELSLADILWYRERGIELHIGDKATVIDRDAKEVVSEKGRRVAYDHVILATGSSPFIPPIPGIEKKGVFAYRTIEDLEAIRSYAATAKSAVVIGGGLLGLEAAKALVDLDLEAHVLEFGTHLMPRQLDLAAGTTLKKKIESLGVQVHVQSDTREVLGNGVVSGLLFADGTRLETEMVIVSAGIRPRDDLARAAGLFVHDRGGILTDDALRTSDPDIFAIGECAVVQSMVYGLVGPCYEMADIVASNLVGESKKFSGADMSTKLKLMGVDVASFGDPFPKDESQKTIVYEDARAGIYKKLVLSSDGRTLAGGMLVGDAEPYGQLLMMTQEGIALPEHPEALLFDNTGDSVEIEMPDTAQVCSCRNVSKGDIRKSICENDFLGIDEVKLDTKAGTGCGGCLPLVTKILRDQLEAKGISVSNDLCSHFAHTRKELFEIIKVKGIRSFDELLRNHGKGQGGCETCKPAVASILASLWNELVVDPEHETLQDTNDRFLANIQRGGTYSVVPRVPGGEITPDQLIVLGEVAKKYGLYSKLTGGQRVDLFGARVDQLPEIWKELIAAGFESGHAYGKALRTVKSCVGSSWCRFGVRDSTGMAIRVEERYRGIRAPHKLKSAVSGCVRECAEAQSKDFGIIATEKGWNLYVGGNGGANPRHADLLAADIGDEELIRLIDRFLMYYIHTGDKLQRTSKWLEAMEGGIEALRDIVVHDKLGIGAELEEQMEKLVDSYKCEWTEVVNDPKRIKQFKHFANADEPDDHLEFIAERGQKRPADWIDEASAVREELEAPPTSETSSETSWVSLARIEDFPKNGGRSVRYGGAQLAVYNFEGLGKWYATQNMCPHKRDMVLARGIIGEEANVPKVACPTHKKTFSLETGEGISDPNHRIRTFPIKVENGQVFAKLPSAEELEKNISCQRKLRA